MTDTAQVRQARQATLERGAFSDGVRTFTVRASSEDAPDSFQVYANGQPCEIVLVISGLISGELKAAWGPDWRSASEPWREWAEAQAFMVFYNGRSTFRGTARVCNG